MSSSIIFPGQNAWIAPRTSGVQLDSNNCQIILNQKIEKIDKVYLNAQNIYFGRRVLELVDSGRSVVDLRPGRLSEFYYDVELTNPVKFADITRWVVEEFEWKLLPSLNIFNNDGKLYKNNTFFYSHNSNIIELPNERVGYWILDANIYLNVLRSLVNYLPDLYIYFDGGLNGRGVAKLTTYDIDTDKSKLMSTQFRVYYTPLGESVKLQVPKTNPQVNQFCIPYSQQQPIVDNTTLGREMQSVANRAGCETREVVRTLNSIKQYRRPRDGYYHTEKDSQGNPTGNIWRLTGAHLTIYSETFMQVVETWSKNWSYRSENVPINREFRSWDIPADIVQRNLLYQDYCLITRKENVNIFDDSLLSDWAKKRILSFSYGTNDNIPTECSNMWFYQINTRINGKGEEINEKHGVVLNCSAFGFGNSLVFSGKTQDNLSAGAQRIKKDTTDSQYQFCKDVYYCNDDGKINQMYIQIGAFLDSVQTLPDPNDATKPIDVSYVSAYMYPEFKTEENTGPGTAKYLPYNAPREGYNLFKEDKIFSILKDPSEQINFTYQLHLLTDDGLLVIGSSWAAKCSLVRQRDGSETMKRWRLKRYLPQGAQVMTSAYGDEYYGAAGIRVDDTESTITFSKITDEKYVGWCATDADNNILFAYNSNEPATFKVLFTHNYKAIAQALKGNN